MQTGEAARRRPRPSLLVARDDLREKRSNRRERHALDAPTAARAILRVLDARRRFRDEGVPVPTRDLYGTEQVRVVARGLRGARLRGGALSRGLRDAQRVLDARCHLCTPIVSVAKG